MLKKIALSHKILWISVRNTLQRLVFPFFYDIPVFLIGIVIVNANKILINKWGSRSIQFLLYNRSMESC